MTDSAPAQRSASAMNVFCPMVISGSSQTTKSTWVSGNSAKAHPQIIKPRLQSAPPALRPCALAPSNLSHSLTDVEHSAYRVRIRWCRPQSQACASASTVSRRLIDVEASTRSGRSATIASRLGVQRRSDVRLLFRRRRRRRNNSYRPPACLRARARKSSPSNRGKASQCDSPARESCTCLPTSSVTTLRVARAPRHAAACRQMPLARCACPRAQRRTPPQSTASAHRCNPRHDLCSNPRDNLPSLVTK